QSFLMAALEAGVAQSSGDGGAAEREVETSIAEVPLDAAADAPGKVWLTAGEVTVDELQAGIRTILAGQDLSTVSMGKLRRRLARTFGFEEDVLDCRADEIKGLAKVVVDEMQACKEEGPAEFMARIISQLGDECASNSMVYLITISNVLPETLAASELRDVASLSREEVGTCILDALDNPLVSARGGRPRTREAGVKVVKKLAVFEEEHASRLPHYHIAVLLFQARGFASAKRTLRERHQLASHWSCSHTQWWSALRYGVIPTLHKSTVDSSPYLWSHDGAALDTFAESQRPYCATLWKRRREEAEKEKSAGVPAKRAKFTKLDLKSKAAVMEYVQNKGTEAMQTFVSNNQRKLKEFLQDAQEWAAARATAAADRESDWDLLCRTASGPCPHGASCSYAAAARRIFEMNTGSLSKEALALSLRAVILKGPSKTTRTPLIVGPTNTGKTTLILPFDKLFGANRVFHKPALGSKFALRNLMNDKRFILWDDYRPVEYAQETIHVATFLSMFTGFPFEVQVSQSFNDGNVDFQWNRGAVLTAKEEGLWKPYGEVSGEDIKHLKARVDIFRCTAKVPSLKDTETCAACMCCWIRDAAAAHDARQVLQQPLLPLLGAPHGASLVGFSTIAEAAHLSEPAHRALEAELLDQGAIHVAEQPPLPARGRGLLLDRVSARATSAKARLAGSFFDSAARGAAASRAGLASHAASLPLAAAAAQLPDLAGCWTKGKVCFASPAQRFFVPRKEKSDLDFGAASCDACGKAFEERLTTGFAVKLAETTETENQRHKALLRSSCRQHLLKGGRLLLTSLEAEAEAAWATTRLTCRQRLEKHGAPYTPKPKRFVDIAAMPTHLTSEELDFVLGLQSTKKLPATEILKKLAAKRLRRNAAASIPDITTVQSFLMAALEAGVAQSSGDGGAAEREVETSIAEVPLDAAADAPGKVWLTAGEVTVDELQAGIRTILAGQDLSTVSMGKLRRRLARTFGFEEDVLDCRADEIKGLAKVVVDEMQACKEEGPAEFMARIISQLGDECASNSMVYLITISNVLPDAQEWAAARATAAADRESDWDLLCRTASGPCPHGASCSYAAAARRIFEMNTGSLSKEALALSLRAVILKGPSKTTRTPLIVGPTNTGKTTLILPFDKLFGANRVFHKPALGSKFALRNLMNDKRFILWDDYRPVEYAQETIHVATFLSMFTGFPFEVQVSQSFNDGNVDFQWNRGAVLTAKEEGLWKPYGEVSGEDIKHLKARVDIFRCTAKVPSLKDTETCAACMCCWIRDAAAAHDARQVLQQPLLPLLGAPHGASLVGFSTIAEAAHLSEPAHRALEAELLDQGAIHVAEVGADDWQHLVSWKTLRPFEQRRTWKKDEGFKWRDAWWPSLASSRRCRLVVGDFYLTESPPELLRPKPGLPGASSTQRREAPRLPGQGLPATRPRSRSPPPRRSCLTSPAAGVQRTTPRAKGKVCFASPAQRFFVPRKEKSDLDFGAASCDACGKAFEERLTTGFAVKLAETTETENQRHKALLCSSCRQHLLKGGRLLLTSLEAEAEAAWATTRLTCRQRLEKHGAPYTPKPKRFVDIAAMPTHLTSEELDFVLGLQSTKKLPATEILKKLAAKRLRRNAAASIPDITTVQSFLMAALEAGVAQSSGDGGAAEREVETSIAEVPLDAAADAPGKVWLTAGEVTVDELQAGIRTILAGQDLSTVSMGKLRRRLARTFGFEEDVLDCRADEIKGLAKVVVDEMQACKEEGPAEFMARIISQLGDECASNSMVYLITISNVLPDAQEWAAARATAAADRESDWDLLCRTASGPCPHGASCSYAAAARRIFEMNTGSLSKEALALSLRAVILKGPSKTTRTPLIVGPTNTGKTTLILPFDKLFGANRVFHKPALGSKFALRNLMNDKRFILWDDYRPVEYAQETIHVATFLSMFTGFPFEVQVSQSFNDGNVDFQWNRGAVLTAKEEGLWKPYGEVSGEDIKHLKARVDIFRCTAKVPSLKDTETCAACMCCWIRDAAAAHDARQVLQQPLLPLLGAPHGASLVGFSTIAEAAHLSEPAHRALEAELLDQGAIHVAEVGADDWQHLVSWKTLRPFEQ
ncbi:unnamed protein product, partial [Polarella glacialis]